MKPLVLQMRTKLLQGRWIEMSLLTRCKADFECREGPSEWFVRVMEMAPGKSRWWHLLMGSLCSDMNCYRIPERSGC